MVICRRALGAVFMAGSLAGLASCGGSGALDKRGTGEGNVVVPYGGASADSVVLPQPSDYPVVTFPDTSAGGSQSSTSGASLPSMGELPAADASFREVVTGREWWVAVGGTGDGSSSKPLGSINAALALAQPGDAVVVKAGTYSEEVATVRDGSASARVIVRGESAATKPLVTRAGRTLYITHSYVTFEDMVFDSQYGAADGVNMRGTKKKGITLRRVEIRNAARDCLDMSDQQDVLIEFSNIHHCLLWSGGRVDAHGITGGPVRNVMIRYTDIHDFSGDAIQFDPGRAAPGWDNVVVDHTRMWLEPLPAAVAGFSAGVVPGENAIDTKVWVESGVDVTLYRPRLYVRDSIAWGFRKGLLTNMAAFNIKEKVIAEFDRVTVFNSEIAFRLRGAGGRPLGAETTARNILIYDVDYGIRYEDNLIYPIRFFNTTLGAGVKTAFLGVAVSGTNVLQLTNTLILGTAFPTITNGTSVAGLAVGPESFVSVATNDYRLAAGSAAIDKGVAVPGLTTDRNGVARPSGAALDIGAFEY
jgi:hypothetical protein